MRYAGARPHCSELTSGNEWLNVDATLLVGIDGARSGDVRKRTQDALVYKYRVSTVYRERREDQSCKCELQNIFGWQRRQKKCVGFSVFTAAVCGVCLLCGCRWFIL